ncbi:MAG TPA: hypothetical protein VGS27_21675 [Candidatus Sulfotelmatobacter sp.]|nr:hypothetical protein [Candidatus Sulfotelmatobacter sp.]
MSKINTYGDDQTDSMAASLVPTNTKQSTEPVPEGYIRYADGTLEKFEEEEIWGEPDLESESPQPPDTDYDRILASIEDL